MFLFFFFRYLFRCDQNYNFNLNVTNFNVEQGMDTLTVYAISPQLSKTVVSEVKAVGHVHTHTNQLLVEFRSDCDISLDGFRGVLTTVKSKDNQNVSTSSMSTSPVPTTKVYETTQSSTS